jgi:hypothetical protein
MGQQVIESTETEQRVQRTAVAHSYLRCLDQALTDIGKQGLEQIRPRSKFAIRPANAVVPRATSSEAEPGSRNCLAVAAAAPISRDCRRRTG